MFLLACSFLSLYGQQEIIKELKNDYLILKKEGKYAISLDTNNVEYPYDTVIVSRIYQNMIIKQNGKWGVIDNKMRNRIKCKYDKIEFSCCYDKIKEGREYYVVEKDNRLGVINHRDKQIVPTKYNAITSWVEYGPEGHYVIADSKIGLITYRGKTIIPVIYDSLYYRNDKIIKAKLKDKFGIINFENETVIPFLYDALIVDFPLPYLKDENHKDKFVVKLGQTWSYLDYQGQIIRDSIPFQEIEKEYASSKLNNYDFEYIGLMFIR